jgi:hypothetical protein
LVQICLFPRNVSQGHLGKIRWAVVWLPTPVTDFEPEYLRTFQLLGVDMLSRRFCAAFIVVFVTLSCLAARAQSTYGAIVGSVTDSSGAAITDANVTLTNVGTSEKRSQSSGSDGLFTFVNLFPGQYRIDVEKPGFKHFVRTGLTVEVQQSTHIDAALQVGEVSQVVEVTAETPLLQSETSSLGTVVDTREANELPLNGRNIYNLATVTPSVIPQGNTEGSVVGKNPFDFANYQIGGAFANEGAEYLDAGCNLRVQGAGQQSWSGMGQVRRRRHQHEHQVGNQHLAWHWVRILTE